MYVHDAKDYSVVKDIQISNILYDLSEARDKTFTD